VITQGERPDLIEAWAADQRDGVHRGTIQRYARYILRLEARVKAPEAALEVSDCPEPALCRATQGRECARCRALRYAGTQ
jgi:hypothetical protein